MDTLYLVKNSELRENNKKKNPHFTSVLVDIVFAFLVKSKVILRGKDLYKNY